MPEASHLAQETYDRIAAGYDELWSRHLRTPQDRLTQGLRLVSGARCADLGCGTGLETVEMLKQITPGEMVGVDCSEEMLRSAKKRAAAEGLGLTTKCADAASFIDSAEASSFDVVTLRFCLAYLDWRAVLPRVARILRPRGRVGILTNLSTSTPQAYSIYCRMVEEFGLSKASLPVPDTIDQVSEQLGRGGLRTEESWSYQFRLWFSSGAEAAGWLQESGFVTHPALAEFTPEVLASLVAIFARRLEEEYRDPQGIPLDFELGGIIASLPHA